MVLQRGVIQSSIRVSVLGVYCVDGLSIADASVVPMIVGANTNAVAAMVGEKAADLLLQQA